jgi:hypothetical protein
MSVFAYRDWGLRPKIFPTIVPSEGCRRATGEITNARVETCLTGITIKWCLKDPRLKMSHSNRGILSRAANFSEIPSKACFDAGGSRLVDILVTLSGKCRDPD